MICMSSVCSRKQQVLPGLMSWTLRCCTPPMPGRSAIAMRVEASRRRGVGAPSSVVEAAPDTGRATVDGEGRILWANPRFTALITDRLDAGHALESLPFQLRWSPRVAAGGIIWRGLHFQVRRSHDDFDLTVRAARQDMPAITEREWAVVRELCAGKTYRQIGETLHMAPTTASSHTYKLMDKLGLRRKHELIQWCQRQAVRLR